MTRETYELTSQTGTIYLPTVIIEDEETSGISAFLGLFRKKKEFPEEPKVEYLWIRREKRKEPKPLTKASYVSVDTAERVIAKGKNYAGNFQKLSELVDGAEKMGFHLEGGLVINVGIVSDEFGIRHSSEIISAKRLG